MVTPTQSGFFFDDYERNKCSCLRIGIKSSCCKLSVVPLFKIFNVLDHHGIWKHVIQIQRPGAEIGASHFWNVEQVGLLRKEKSSYPICNVFVDLGTEFFTCKISTRFKKILRIGMMILIKSTTKTRLWFQLAPLDLRGKDKDTHLTTSAGGVSLSLQCWSQWSYLGWIHQQHSIRLTPKSP